MALRVMAISAPENQKSVPGQFVLKSKDPVSLYNACRCAASLAMDGVGSWGESNWATNRNERKKTIMLMHSFEDELFIFEKMLQQERPNLLLIGAMSVCLPGAIACARKAKEILGDEVCVVLGGRHATESIYLNHFGKVVHHAGSPLILMARHSIPKVFDVVISGEGEYIIPWIGEAIDSLDIRHISLSKIAEYMGNVNEVPGRWILGFSTGNQISTIINSGIPIDKNLLPSPCEVFGINSSFDVFKDRMTAHVFSDTGCGCVFDCSFCSERRSVTGPPSQLSTGSNRLFRQLQIAERVINEDYPGRKASAFIEDSTILSGSALSLRQLAKLLDKKRFNIRFGGQLTIDQTLSRIEELRLLKKVGLDYVFIGIETIEPHTIGGDE